MVTETSSAIREELARAFRNSKCDPPRSIVDFVLSDFVLPDGRSKGQRFTFARQPVLRLWFEAIDSGLFNEFVFTAPSQFGKTLSGFVAPLLYHLCEIQENYVLGVPYGDMAANKWEADIDPVLQASPRLRGMRPKHGSGSSGGRVRDSVTMAHGCICKFMSAGGQDAAKAGFTARTFGVTEAKAFSELKEASDEADALRQLRARQRSYPEDERRSYVEGTVGKSDQLPWTLMPLSTRSRIVSPCPHCAEHISCEREDLHGWPDAKSEAEAKANAYFACPECGEKITERQRAEALKNAVLLHYGQTIDKTGRIHGKPPTSRRLWFRCTAWHNMFLGAGDIAVDEWRATQLTENSPEQQSAERELCQFVWCIPWDPPKLDTDIELDKVTISNRRLSLPRGTVPEDTVRVTVGTDMGMRTGWYLQLATRANGSRHICDYDCFDVPSHAMKLDEAVKVALNDLHKHLSSGVIFPDGRVIVPGERWYDAGYRPTPVLEFVYSHSGGNYNGADVAAYGRGATAIQKGTFTLPNGKSTKVRQIGDDRLWFMERERGQSHLKLYWDSDSTKYEVMQMLTLPETEPGSITLYSGVAKIHDRLARHLTNEPLTTVVNSLGVEKQMFVRKGANHLLDCLAMAIRADSRLAWRIENTMLRASSGDGHEWYDEDRRQDWYDET
ncbi:phage terminase GpA [Rhodopirellula maiorica SM1]|uniref:Phage terminase GpA n=1 Tax=Rhodopirellula maiorica SM1 TaxID=1265738 RepID=M5RFA6_9BACT|nr:terminase gpA endonuclease subunit [Rhodopirellula maiorica]EMI17776.1 phage terminase GpA [Rhodopirellula maiorica SM1]